jgi:hypothetical protein
MAGRTSDFDEASGAEEVPGSGPGDYKEGVQKLVGLCIDAFLPGADAVPSVPLPAAAEAAPTAAAPSAAPATAEGKVAAALAAASAAVAAALNPAAATAEGSSSEEEPAQVAELNRLIDDLCDTGGALEGLCETKWDDEAPSEAGAALDDGGGAAAEGPAVPPGVASIEGLIDDLCEAGGALEGMCDVKWDEEEAALPTEAGFVVPVPRASLPGTSSSSSEEDVEAWALDAPSSVLRFADYSSDEEMPSEAAVVMGERPYVLGSTDQQPAEFSQLQGLLDELCEGGGALEGMCEAKWDEELPSEAGVLVTDPLAPTGAAGESTGQEAEGIQGMIDEMCDGPLEGMCEARWDDQPAEEEDSATASVEVESAQL